MSMIFAKSLDMEEAVASKIETPLVEQAMRKLGLIVCEFRGNSLSKEEAAMLTKKLDDIKFLIKCMERPE